MFYVPRFCAFILPISIEPCKFVLLSHPSYLKILLVVYLLRLTTEIKPRLSLIPETQLLDA